MEILNGESKTILTPGSPTTFGRFHGFNSPTKTVSRRHITFMLDPKDDQKVRFEVIGKNPIWKHSKRTGKVEVFRPFGKGRMENGDMFCVSAENPIWFTLKKREVGVESADQLEILEEALGVEGGEELDVENVDISNIDPIKEFGLVVMGHEFDGYGKRIKLDARKWDWFIEEPEGEESDDDDDGGDKRKGKRIVNRKKRKGEERDDEEWTGESEEEKELLTKSRKVPKPSYSTRSKEISGKTKVSRNAQPKLSGRKKTIPAQEDEGVKDADDDEDENDETLGGFIVDDVSDEEEDMDDDEDEEEFEEDELED